MLSNRKKANLSIIHIFSHPTKRDLVSGKMEKEKTEHRA